MDPIYQFGGDLLLLQLPSGEFLFFCRRHILDYPPLLQNERGVEIAGAKREGFIVRSELRPSRFQISMDVPSHGIYF